MGETRALNPKEAGDVGRRGRLAGARPLIPARAAGFLLSLIAEFRGAVEDEHRSSYGWRASVARPAGLGAAASPVRSSFRERLGAFAFT